MTQRTGQLRKAAPTVAFKRQGPPRLELLLTYLGTQKESEDHSNDTASFYEQGSKSGVRLSSGFITSFCHRVVPLRNEFWQSTEWESTIQQTKLDA